MSKPNLRTTGVLVLCAGWAYACGGGSFTAGGAGSGGSSTAGASSQAGSTSSGGSSAAGASGGSSEAGSGQSGGVGGLGVAGAPEGGKSGGASGGRTGAAGNAGASGRAGASGGGASGHAGASGVGGSSGHGGASGGGGASAGGGGTSGNAGAAGVLNSGDCLVNKDCGTGNQCVALSPAGFRTCVIPPTPPTTCGSTTDQCCPSDPNQACASGKTCVRSPLGPSCGGLVMAPSNVCAAQQCMTNADCSGSNAICVPAGALDRPISTCITGGCRRDEECKDSAGGKCEPVTPNCCNGPSGLYCVYPGTGCRSNSDCGSGSSCQIANGKGACVVGSSLCAG